MFLLKHLYERFLYLFFTPCFLICIQILGTGFVIIVLNLGQRKPGDVRYTLIWKIMYSQFDSNKSKL